MNIQKILEKAAEERASKEKKRTYLGCSEIGRCARELWLKYNGHFTPKFSGKSFRIMKDGNDRENEFIEELICSGIFVDQRQREFSWFDGKLKGHWDGRISIYSKKMAFEFKAMKQNRFRDVSKNGLLNFENGVYYAQNILYMHGSGEKECLFVAEHKDTGNIYEEIIPYNQYEAEKYLDKAKLIIYSDHPPKGISQSPDWYVCRMCGANTNELCRKVWPGEKTYDF